MDDNSVAFKKKFDTCDPHDLKMHEGTMYVLWARGDEELDLDRGSYIATPNSTAKDNGMQMVQILRADAIDIPERLVMFSNNNLIIYANLFYTLPCSHYNNFVLLHITSTHISLNKCHIMIQF